MSEAEVAVSLRLLEQKWAVLPAAAKMREHDLLYRFIENIPTTNKRCEDRRERLLEELEEAEAAGQEPPWTKEQLVSRIGVLLGRHPPLQRDQLQ